MDIKKILETEKKNYNKIYLYIDTEQEICRAYELSAYLLYKVSDSLEILKGTDKYLETTFFFTKVPLEKIVERFTDPNTTVGDRYIKIVLDGPNRCMQWRAEFEKLKKLQ